MVVVPELSSFSEACWGALECRVQPVADVTPAGFGQRIQISPLLVFSVLTLPLFH